jgi:signal peptidase I
MANKKKSASSPRSNNVVAQARGRAKRPGGARGSVAWEHFKSFAGAVLIFLVVKTFLIEAYRIPSGSMIPTLLIGDWLFVNKLVYGPKIPFADASLPGYREPQRGDVVVFQSPPQVDQPDDPTPTLVKRLVGMPNDTLYMRDGLLHVNGIAQRQGFAAASNPGPGADEIYSDLFAWQQTYTIRGSRFGNPPARPSLDDWGPLVIPPGNYFMMGDNRYCSKDSRFWGLVPRGNIRGRPMFVYYSYRPGDVPGECSPETSTRPLPFITDIRWGRIGTWIR